MEQGKDSVLMRMYDFVKADEDLTTFKKLSNLCQCFKNELTEYFLPQSVSIGLFGVAKP